MHQEYKQSGDERPQLNLKLNPHHFGNPEVIFKYHSNKVFKSNRLVRLQREFNDAYRD